MKPAATPQPSKPSGKKPTKDNKKKKISSPPRANPAAKSGPGTSPSAAVQDSEGKETLNDDS